MVCGLAAVMHACEEIQGQPIRHMTVCNARTNIHLLDPRVCFFPSLGIQWKGFRQLHHIATNFAQR